MNTTTGARNSEVPHYEFIWTNKIIEHITDNDVTIEEFEDIVRNPEREDSSRSTGLPCSFGYANDGRYLICIYKNIDELHVEPVTAYEV
ncbi:MAG: hypothetical protein HON53_08865 [Planctomycetaceae bacterium]|nr:hypothetical protein [Planctomycetaceae bacterium]MBT6155910.1 hypothetical protein [Planctomycetaceae bacterium]MBT6483175.1 hypothetical protein [Planctomycetaceae bacterium]MBT6495179.1 hypothetical protein [Planctomycetaceae bacterium]